MPCNLPLTAWKQPGIDQPLVGDTPPRNGELLKLPCGKCTSCRLARAKHWALRCTLELQQHTAATFATLTYQDKYCPPTLEKAHLQAFLKRTRAALHRSDPNRTVRFFANGEYGERYGRPHYHAILYGITAAERPTLEKTWRLGHIRADALTPGRIAYCAGYTMKKAAWQDYTRNERISPEGEPYYYQPPFLQMSRRPGIGSHAREHHDSWRNYAILNGQKMSVPRYLHESWLAQATETEIESLQTEKDNWKQNNNKETLTDTAQYHREANEKIAEAKRALHAETRQL